MNAIEAREMFRELKRIALQYNVVVMLQQQPAQESTRNVWVEYANPEVNRIAVGFVRINGRHAVSTDLTYDEARQFALEIIAETEAEGDTDRAAAGQSATYEPAAGGSESTGDSKPIPADGVHKDAHGRQDN